MMGRESSSRARWGPDVKVERLSPPADAVRGAVRGAGGGGGLFRMH